MRIKADFELRCHEYEGIEAIKAALLAGEAKSRDKCDVKVGSKLKINFLPHDFLGIVDGEMVE